MFNGFSSTLILRVLSVPTTIQPLAIIFVCVRIARDFNKIIFRFFVWAFYNLCYNAIGFNG